MMINSAPARRTLSIALAFVASACVKEQRPKESTSDTTQLAPIVTTIPVNQSTAGTSERISWIFSDDRHAVLVVADPVGVEAEPVPNSFFFGDEASGFQTQAGNVWDVAVAPDWKSIAFSNAYPVTDGSGQYDPGTLADVARRTSIDTATIRASSFPVSGMSAARAIAQPGVIRIAANQRSANAADSAAPKMFPVARGWRVRWTADGAFIALGNPPSRALDAEPSDSWSALDPATGALHGTLPADARIVEPKMIAGPVLHGGVSPDMSGAPPIKVTRDGREITIISERGVITISSSAAGDTTAVAPHVVGPGIALAATAGGGYIIAIAPRTKVESGQYLVEPVVYRVSW